MASDQIIIEVLESLANTKPGLDPALKAKLLNGGLPLKERLTAGLSFLIDGLNEAELPGVFSNSPLLDKDHKISKNSDLKTQAEQINAALTAMAGNSLIQGSRNTPKGGTYLTKTLKDGGLVAQQGQAFDRLVFDTAYRANALTAIRNFSPDAKPSTQQNVPASQPAPVAVSGTAEKWERDRFNDDPAERQIQEALVAFDNAYTKNKTYSLENINARDGSSIDSVQEALDRIYDSHQTALVNMNGSPSTGFSGSTMFSWFSTRYLKDAPDELKHKWLMQIPIDNWNSLDKRFVEAYRDYAKNKNAFIPRGLKAPPLVKIPAPPPPADTAAKPADRQSTGDSRTTTDASRTNTITTETGNNSAASGNTNTVTGDDLVKQMQDKFSEYDKKSSADKAKDLEKAFKDVQGGLRLAIPAIEKTIDSKMGLMSLFVERKKFTEFKDVADINAFKADGNKANNENFQKALQQTLGVIARKAGISYEGFYTRKLGEDLLKKIDAKPGLLAELLPDIKDENLKKTAMLDLIHALNVMQAPENKMLAGADLGASSVLGLSKEGYSIAGMVMSLIKGFLGIFGVRPETVDSFIGRSLPSLLPGVEVDIAKLNGETEKADKLLPREKISRIYTEAFAAYEGKKGTLSKADFEKQLTTDLTDRISKALGDLVPGMTADRVKTLVENTLTKDVFDKDGNLDKQKLNVEALLVAEQICPPDETPAPARAPAAGQTAGQTPARTNGRGRGAPGPSNPLTDEEAIRLQNERIANAEKLNELQTSVKATLDGKKIMVEYKLNGQIVKVDGTNQIVGYQRHDIIPVGPPVGDIIELYNKLGGDNSRTIPDKILGDIRADYEADNKADSDDDGLKKQLGRWFKGAACQKVRADSYIMKHDPKKEPPGIGLQVGPCGEKKEVKDFDAFMGGLPYKPTPNVAKKTPAPPPPSAKKEEECDETTTTSEGSGEAPVNTESKEAPSAPPAASSEKVAEMQQAGLELTAQVPAVNNNSSNGPPTMKFRTPRR